MFSALEPSPVVFVALTAAKATCVFVVNLFELLTATSEPFVASNAIVDGAPSPLSIVKSASNRAFALLLA